MAYRHAHACVEVSKRFFNKYKNYPFGCKDVVMDVIKPNQFFFTTEVYDNEPKSIRRVTNAAISVYQRGYNDSMSCVDKITIKSVLLDV